MGCQSYHWEGRLRLFVLENCAVPCRSQGQLLSLYGTAALPSTASFLSQRPRPYPLYDVPKTLSWRGIHESVPWQSLFFLRVWASCQFPLHTAATYRNIRGIGIILDFSVLPVSIIFAGLPNCQKFLVYRLMSKSRKTWVCVVLLLLEMEWLRQSQLALADLQCAYEARFRARWALLHAVCLSCVGSVTWLMSNISLALTRFILRTLYRRSKFEVPILWWLATERSKRCSGSFVVHFWHGYLSY
jgi:hypothetical protein